MKVINSHFLPQWLSGILVLTTLIVSSCSLENFPQPLPLDVKNSSRFPEELRGRWLTIEDSNWVIIDKRLLLFIGESRPAKLIRGVWPKLSGNKITTELPYGFESEKYQHFDSLYHITDTAINYIVTEKAVYQVLGRGMLSSGYPFNKQGDTLDFIKKDTVWLDLGRNMCIRELGNGLYVLNINNNLLAQESNWWQMVLLEMNTGDTVKCWGPGEKMNSSPEFIYYFEEKYFSAAYYESYWTKATILQMKEQGYFDLKGMFIRK